MDMSKLHDIALDYDLDIQITTDRIVECREKMFKEKDSRELKSIVPLLDILIYEAGQYKEWIEQMTDANIDSEDKKGNDKRVQTMQKLQRASYADKNNKEQNRLRVLFERPPGTFRERKPWI